MPAGSSLAERVLAILESVTDKRAAAEFVVTFVEMATKAEMATAQAVAEERAAAERRETQRVRKANWRAKVSRDVPGTERDVPGQDGTKCDSVPPLDPPSVLGSSLSLRADPERAIPGLPAFPVVGGTREWWADTTLLEIHQQAFPDIDVLAEYRKANAWCVSNPAKRKTARGMAKALFAWLCSGQEKGTAIRRRAPGQNAASAKPSGLAVYCDWHRDARNDRQPNKINPKADCPCCKHIRAQGRPRSEDSQLALGGKQ